MRTINSVNTQNKIKNIANILMQKTTEKICFVFVNL